MRLNSFQMATILEGIKKFCGQEAQVWLFGSRVDDLKLGGDIDLYIEIDSSVDMLKAKLNLMSYFEIKLGEQKIDLLMRYKDQPMSPIHEIAKNSGVLLQ